jgi:hypothetical protein
MGQWARVVICLAWAFSQSALLFAQTAAPKVSPVTGGEPALPGFNGTNANIQPVSPPGTKTPADTFRELLAMSPTERAQALASRSEHNRNYVEEQLLVYQSLPPDQREARLRQLELRCLVPLLMKLPPASRAERLKTVSPELRPLIEQRLQQWDRLPGPAQKEVLDLYDTTATSLVRAKPTDVSTGDLAPPPLPPTPDEDKPRKLLESFFELSPKEQERTLEVLSPAERDEMEKTLDSFKKLSPEQRRICIDSFDKLNRMTREQRDQFLKAAARWKAMSPRERDTWSTLLKILPATPSAVGLPPSTQGAPHAPVDVVSNPPAGLGVGN